MRGIGHMCEPATRTKPARDVHLAKRYVGDRRPSARETRTARISVPIKIQGAWRGVHARPRVDYGVEVWRLKLEECRPTFTIFVAAECLMCTGRTREAPGCGAHEEEARAIEQVIVTRARNRRCKRGTVHANEGTWTHPKHIKPTASVGVDHSRDEGLKGAVAPGRCVGFRGIIRAAREYRRVDAVCDPANWLGRSRVALSTRDSMTCRDSEAMDKRAKTDRRAVVTPMRKARCE